MTSPIVNWAGEGLPESEDRLRLIIDTIPVMAWTVRPDGAVDFINRRWHSYTGISLEEDLKSRRAQCTPKTFTESWKSGWRTWPPGNRTRMKCAYSGLTGNTAGS